MSDAKLIAAMQRQAADAEVERLRLVERVAVLEAAVAAGREACARVAETVRAVPAPPRSAARAAIAAAIRARGAP